MNLLNVLKTRYTTRAYDTTRRIPQETMDQLLAALRYSPSSVNAQPWHFIVADNQAGKDRIAASTPGVSSYNTPKIKDASHVIVLCARDVLSEDYLNEVLEQEDKDGRYENAEAKDGFKGARGMYVGLHEKAGDVAAWNQKQVYLAQGFLLLAAGMLGVDATPIEGFEPELLSKEFGLKEKGLTPLVIVSLGYHAEADNNAKRPKSRLENDVIFSRA